jgi:thioredoxin:protein disulfide reductase
MSSIPALPARWFVRLLALLLPALAVVLPAAAADDDFLPVRSAFKVTLDAEPNVLVVNLDIAPGYYLYRDRLGFESATPGVTLGQPTLPVGLDHEDEFFGKQVVYREVVRVGVPVTFAGAAQDFEVKVKLQGCADAGLCYPPQTWTLPARWPAAMAGVATQEPAAAPTAGAKSGGLNLRSIFGSGARSDADFLPVDKAFVLSAESTARDRIQLRWDVADDYYLYRDKVVVKTVATDVQLGKVSIAGGESKHDEYFGEQVVFHGEMVADLPIAAAAGVTSVPLEISYQGCADAGLCYPPVKKTVVVQLASTQPW